MMQARPASKPDADSPHDMGVHATDERIPPGI
jgi:hypothetical protein